LETKRI
jgi:16S rRNA (cytosine1402-N4)-methyltransferase